MSRASDPTSVRSTASPRLRAALGRLTSAVNCIDRQVRGSTELRRQRQALLRAVELAAEALGEEMTS
jgi:hypothetical protein